MLANSTGATPALALTWNPVPGVAKTVPRGEFANLASPWRVM